MEIREEPICFNDGSLRAALRPLKMLAAVLAAVAAAQAGATVQAQPWAVQIAPDAPAVEHFAARELQSLLSGLCPRLPEPAPRRLRAPQPPTTLLLGYAAVRRALPPSRLPLLSELGDEGFVLGSLSAGGGPAYVLSGGEGAARGTLYAVYEWLHQLGVRFYAWDETHFPPCPAELGGDGAALPALPLQQHSAPLEYRYMPVAPSSPTMDEHHMWLLRSRFNVVEDEDWYAPPNGSWWTAEHGGGWTNAIGFPEATSYTIFGPGPRNGSGPPLKYYNQHREWFWPNNNSAVDGQLCFSNASLVSFLTERVRSILTKQPNATLFSLSVLDNKLFCQTPAELAVIADEGGSPMGPLMRALNSIGAALEQEFPHVTLVTLAYLSFTPPPKTAPRHNVAVRNFRLKIRGNSTIFGPYIFADFRIFEGYCGQVRVCSVSCDFGRPLSDPTNSCDGFKAEVDSWVALGKQVGPSF